MDYSQYFVVPIAHERAVQELFEERRLIHDGKFWIVISDDQKALKKLPVALDFHNDEWSAWGFTVYRAGVQVAHGLFGENAESGVSLEDNTLDGDLDAAATLLGVVPKKLRAVVEEDEPSVEKFMKAVGFGRYSITPYELDREPRGEKQEMFDPKPAPKTKTKMKTKAKAKPKAKAKAKPRAKAKGKPRAKAKAKPRSR
jgi:hypothetical protein